MKRHLTHPVTGEPVILVTADPAPNLRAALARLVRQFDPEDIVQILSECLDDESTAHAIRTGDYDHANYLTRVALALARLKLEPLEL